MLRVCWLLLSVELNHPVHIQLSEGMKSGSSIARSTAGYFLSYALLGLSAAALGPTLPELANNTHARLGDLGVLFTARALGTMFGALQSGRLYDRLAGNPLMSAGLFGMAALLALIPGIRMLTLLVVILLLLGMIEGLLDVGGSAQIVWAHQQNSSPFLNGLHFFYGLGAFLSPILVAAALTWTGAGQTAYRGLAVLILPVAISLARFSSPARIKTPSDGQPPRQDPVLIFLVSLFLFLYVGAEVSMGGWIYTYATTLKLGTLTSSAYLTSAFWGGLTFGRLLSIPLTARLHPKYILAADLLGALACLSLIRITQNSSIGLWAGTIGTGFCMASVFPTAIALAQKRIQLTGKATGWFFVGGSAGAMGLPWLIGRLFLSSGAQILPLAVSTNLVAALLLLGGLSRRKPVS